MFLEELNGFRQVHILPPKGLSERFKPGRVLRILMIPVLYYSHCSKRYLALCAGLQIIARIIPEKEVYTRNIIILKASNYPF